MPLATDWSPIIIALGASIPGLVAALISYLNRKALHMPSGGTIGEKVEQNSHLAAAIVSHTTEILNGQRDASAEPEPPAPPAPGA